MQAGIEAERWGRATAGLGEVWETMAVAVKPLPACHFTHACSDAALALAKQHKFAIPDIERIKALVPAEVVKTVCEPEANKRRPANAYDAQFSIPYLVAASLVRGRFTLAELEPDALTDERILHLCDLVDYEVDPRSTFPRHYTGEVQISLKDGRKLVHREALNRGCADRPLSNADIVDKFTGNARMSLSARQADAVREAVLGLEEADGNPACHRSHLPGKSALIMLPLAGLRIIAVEQYGAGPFGSMLLADLGAEVIKIENPAEGGDVSRSVGPHFFPDGDSHFYQSLNRNKKSLTLNLKHPQAPGRLAQARAHGRCDLRQPARRSAGEAGRHLRAAAGIQPQDRLRASLRLRPRGSAQILARLRLPDAGRGRLSGAHRRARRPAEPHGPLHRRPDDRA